MAEDLQQLYRLALEAHEGNRFARAVELYGRILDRYPDADLVLYNQGLAYYELDRFSEAARAFSRAAAVRDDDPDIWFNLGLALKEDSRFHEARRAYERALNLKPDEPDFLYNLASCCKECGDTDQAIVCYKRILRIDPDDTSSLNNLAYLLHLEGELAQAEETYQRLLERIPGHPAARHMLAALQGHDVALPPQEYVRDLFDRYSDHFESSLVDTLGYRTPQLLKDALDVLNREQVMYDCCLDLGCGTGLAGVVFRPLCRKLIGVDLSANMVAGAREKQIYDRLQVADILSWLQEQQGMTFDLFVAADVLTYLGDLSPLMQAVTVRSHPGSLFCFSTETNPEQGWKLQPTGRFAHYPGYVKETAARCGWQVLFEEALDLRREGAGWVRGDIYILIRKAD